MWDGKQIMVNRHHTDHSKDVSYRYSIMIKINQGKDCMTHDLRHNKLIAGAIKDNDLARWRHEAAPVAFMRPRAHEKPPL
jgi:hypothetical protein